MTFPRKVNLYEVGPRDGLQNEKEIIPIDVKVNLINKLINCNFKEIEIGSFVSPKWVPQMADSEIIIDKINQAESTSFPVLTPNLKGVQKSNVELLEIFKGIMPFLAIVIFGMFLMYMFPGIALWLPEVLFAD